MFPVPASVLEDLMVDLHLLDVKGNVLPRFPLDGFPEFGLAHGHHGNTLDDDRVSVHGRGDAEVLDVLVSDEFVIASITAPVSMIVPPTIASAGSGSMPKDLSWKPLPLPRSLSSTSLMAEDPISRPTRFLLFPKNTVDSPFQSVLIPPNLMLYFNISNASTKSSDNKRASYPSNPSPALLEYCRMPETQMQSPRRGCAQWQQLLTALGVTLCPAGLDTRCRGAGMRTSHWVSNPLRRL